MKKLYNLSRDYEMIYQHIKNNVRCSCFIDADGVCGMERIIVECSYSKKADSIFFGCRYSWVNFICDEKNEKEKFIELSNKLNAEFLTN